MNRDLTVKWAEAAGALTGTVRKQVPAEPASDLVGEQATRAGAEPPS
jgi:ketol-acid reductoisomerase